MPGGVTAGYSADTGLDLAGSPRDVFAIASGTLDYAEAGHTLWNGRHDSKLAARITLDEPIRLGDRTITHVWYAHLSEVAIEVHEGSGELIHVEAGQRLGRSGTANGSPHLHLGMLLDGDVSQSWGTFLLEDDVRRVLCGWSKGKRLPDPASDKVRAVRPAALARSSE
jgi:murein DD-endopeptidase MepM/ murein hydrolase activator NlpD